MRNIEEIINKYQIDKSIDLTTFTQTERSGMDSNEVECTFLGKLTQPIMQQLQTMENELSRNWHCGCAHDCCGCACGQYFEFKKISRGKVKLTFSQSYNY